jgi:hypothetical protein
MMNQINPTLGQRLVGDVIKIGAQRSLIKIRSSWRPWVCAGQVGLTTPSVVMMKPSSLSKI